MTDNQYRSGQDDIREAVHERVRQEAEQLQAPGSPKSNGKISSVFIEQCLNANELGDGLLYAEVNKNQILYNNTIGGWMVWEDHHWGIDVMQSAYARVESVVDRLLEEVEDIDAKVSWAVKHKDDSQAVTLNKKRDKILKRILRLRNDNGRNAALKFARTCNDPIAVRGDEFDLNPWLLGCANGVIDLRTGKHFPGRPEDLISKSAPAEWKGLNVPAEKWEKTLLEIFDGDRELVAYLQRLFGYGITGLNIEHFFPVFWGQGRNGKSLIIDVISHVLGELAGPIQPEMLLDQGRVKNSAGPSPDIMGLKGLRLAFASETDEGRRFSLSKVKWLTGGDKLIGRNPNDKYSVTFRPTHTLILLTNAKPHAASDDFAFWERMHLLPFTLSFVDRDPVPDTNERRAVKGLAEQIMGSEMAGVLAWLIRGCLMYQRDGLNPPDIVRSATADYKRNEDPLADFMEAHCFEDKHARASAAELYNRYETWFEKNVSKHVPKQKTFGTWLSKRFDKKKSSGVYFYYGIGLIEGESGDDTLPGMQL